MRILGPAVLPQALLVASRQAQLRFGRSVGPELVGDKHLGRKALFPEQIAHELRGRPCVAPPLHKEIENLAPRRRLAPEPESSAPRLLDADIEPQTYARLTHPHVWHTR